MIDPMLGSSAAKKTLVHDGEGHRAQKTMPTMDPCSAGQQNAADHDAHDRVEDEGLACKNLCALISQNLGDADESRRET